MTTNRLNIDKRVSTFLAQLQPQSDSASTPVYLASQLLREALLAPASQKIWSRFNSDNVATDKGVLSYRAISRAISDSERKQYGIDAPPNRYKDRVRRAIIGDRLTVETLRLFTETFPFPEKTSQRIYDLITHNPFENISAQERRIPRIDITTTLYDVYINPHLRVYQIRINIVFRALEDFCEYLWAPIGTDFDNIKIHQGGSLKWHENFKMYFIEFDTPLNTSECGELLYTLTIQDAPDDEEDAFLATKFTAPRSSVFFRFFFDDIEKAPSTINISRKSMDKESMGSETFSQIAVHSGRASVYFERVQNDLLVFFP